MIEPNHFDRSKPFYPLVMNYLYLLFGFKELAVRGVLEKFKSKLGGSPDEEPAVLRKLDEDTRNQVKKLWGPLELRSESQGTPIVVHPEEVAADIFSNHGYLLPVMVRSAGGLLILAYETTRDWNDRSPIWEFLRHCRNAAAHNGRFRLDPHEPKRSAAWSSFVVDKSTHGLPLFKGEDRVGLLSPGDPIRLLWDLEQAYPAMVVSIPP